MKIKFYDTYLYLFFQLWTECLLYFCEILDYYPSLRVNSCLRLCYKWFHVGTFFLLPNNLQYLGSSRVSMADITKTI